MAEHSQTSNPFAKMFSEMNAPWCGAVKQVAAQYLDLNEKWAQQALKWSEKTTEWTKATPLAFLFEAQRLIARQTVDLSTDIARRLWQLESKVEEKVGEALGTQS
jgi:hypothetical protein